MAPRTLATVAAEAEPMVLQATMFDYDQLDLEDRIVVRERASQVRDEIQQLAALVRQTAQTVWRLGTKLLDVQTRLAPDGLWLAWCEAELPTVSRATIYNAISVAKAFPEFPTVGNEALELPLKALYLLSAPSTPPEARAEVIEAAAAGKAIETADVQAVVAKHKPDAGAGRSGGANRSSGGGQVARPSASYDDEDEEAEEDDGDGEEIATIPAAAHLPPPLPAAVLAAAPADIETFKQAAALSLLLSAAARMAAEAEEKIAQRIGNPDVALDDATVRQAAAMLMQSPAMKAQATFLAMSLRVVE